MLHSLPLVLMSRRRNYREFSLSILDCAAQIYFRAGPERNQGVKTDGVRVNSQCMFVTVLW